MENREDANTSSEPSGPMTLGHRWKVFLSILFDPWTVLSLISVFILFIWDASAAPAAQTTKFILLSLSSAFVGGRLVKLSDALVEESALRARGKISVRGLKLMLKGVANLEQRIVVFSTEMDDIDDEVRGPITQRNYRELGSSLGDLQEQTLSSIENWTDILPEEDLVTSIGLITELRGRIAAKTAEAEKLEEAYAKLDATATEERKTMSTEISTIEKEKAALKSQLTDARYNASGILSIPLGSPMRSSITHPNSLAQLLSDHENSIGGEIRFPIKRNKNDEDK